MHRIALLLVCLVLLLAAPLSSAHAEKRVALVVGNDVYPNLAARSQLKKAVADARAVRDTLGSLGFEVIYEENATLARTKELFFDFSGKLAAGDIAFVYYAGHGVALGGANYLLPADIPAIRQPETEAAIAEEEERLAEFAVSEAFAIQRIKAKGARVAILVLDACRDNPLRLAEGQNPFRSTRPGDLVFGATRGLALLQSRPEGIVSIYSANFGQRALDRLGNEDTDPNSPFTRVFLKHLATPGKGLRQVMLETRDEVVRLARAIDVEQRPAIYDEMVGGDIFLAGEGESGFIKADQPQPPILVPPVDAVAADFALAKDIGTEDAWEAFLERHGANKDSFYVKLAEAALKKVAVGIFTADEEPKKEAPAPEAKRVYKPGDTFRDCDLCPEMVVLPAGKFTMGSPASEKDRYADEGPQHRVTIPRPFAVGKFEVTFAEWDACVAGGGCNGYRPLDEGWGRGERPVISVSWDDAKAYVKWLAKMTGEDYRLLSEAEWEYAARAGTTTPFSTGKTITTDEGNFNGNATYNGSRKGKYRQKTTPVGTFAANDFGLHDMHGNVWEWMEDCGSDSYRKAPADGTARTTGDCSARVLRGGSWNDGPRNLRSAVRDRGGPTYRSDVGGFRVARTLRP